MTILNATELDVIHEALSRYVYTLTASISSAHSKGCESSVELLSSDLRVVFKLLDEIEHED